MKTNIKWKVGDKVKIKERLLETFDEPYCDLKVVTIERIVDDYNFYICEASELYYFSDIEEETDNTKFFNYDIIRDSMMDVADMYKILANKTVRVVYGYDEGHTMGGFYDIESKKTYITYID